MKRRYVASLMFALGCGGAMVPGANEPGTNSKSDSVSTPDNLDTVTLIQAGAFRVTQSAQSTFDVTQSTMPQLVHAGQVDSRGAAWNAVQDVTVQYKSTPSTKYPGYNDYTNEAVTIKVAPSDGALVVFTFKYQPYAAIQWNQNLYIDLTAREGTLVQVPFSTGESYPFLNHPACYTYQTGGANSPGKPVALYWGFTTASASDFASNANVAWQNASGDAVAEGVLSPIPEETFDYKPVTSSLPVYVWVPAGENLVYSLTIDYYAPTNCSDGGGETDDTFTHDAPSGTLFLAVP